MATEVIDRDRINTLLEKLETRKTLLTTCTELYNTISNHFTALEQSLLDKSKALDSRIEAFDSETKKTLESIEHRENSIPERGSAAVTRVEKRKELALSEIERAGPETLRLCCRKMDSVGLLRFMLSKRKESVSLRSEVAAAVEESVDPVTLVLDVIEEFVSMKVVKVGVGDRRWACGMLIQALFPGSELGGEGLLGIAGSVKERAAGVAEKWKGVMDGEEGGGVGAAEVAMFLQMVVGFGLRAKFEEEFLRKLVVGFAARRDMAKLAADLGFGEKMGDIIDELVKSGKEVEAVYFASESGLTERFSPVALLKSHLRNSRKNANTILGNGNYSKAAKEEASALELNSIKAIIKCVEDHKLESEFTIDSIKKRATQLEKAKAEKRKSTASTSKPSNKRPYGGGGRGRGRGSGPPTFRPAEAGRFSNVPPSFGHRNPSQSPQIQAVRYSAPFNYPSQSGYEGPSTASYGPGYGGTYSQSPVALPQQYSFATHDVRVSGVRASGSYGTQTNYGAYDYSAAPAPAPAPAYPPSYPQ